MAQQILRDIIREGDLVIDATAGNGHDTLFLAKCVGAAGKVLAFDVQEAAIASARAKVEKAGFGAQVEFFLESHEQMDSHTEVGSVSAVMFNLGYLPGDDHELTTEAWSTIVALEIAAKSLKQGGVLSVVCYPGHSAGAVEAMGVESWMKVRAKRGWRVTKYGAIGTQKPAPFLLLAARSGEEIADGSLA
ncbi:MAG: class I SAM-dependent methyltransferase [Luteolibacter sp.]